MFNVAAKIADQILGKAPTATATQPNVDETRKMHALIWDGKYDIKYVEKPRPLVTDPTDIVLRVTASTICGSDLHLYSGSIPCLKGGDILGHEFMGIVEDKGTQVEGLNVGDRVVIAFDIACGFCPFCKREEYTSCDNTNSSKLQEEMYGSKTGALFGYSHLTGGVPGGQSEYVRVPFADVNCLKVPNSLSDEQVLYLSDVVPTAYHGTEMGEVKAGESVAIWGLGPVGLMIAKWCQLRGAGAVIGIDSVPDRLRIAKEILKIDTINFKEQDVYKVIRERFPYGVDVVVEAAGFEYAKTWKHKIEMAVGLETDTADILTEMFACVRNSGKVSIIGVYVGFANHFPIGAMMEKGLTVRGGQSPTQKYWKMCLEKIQSGELDPTFIITHKASLSAGPELYKKFNNKEEGIIKVFLRPDHQINP